MVLTHARHLVSGDYAAANTAFDDILAKHLQRELPTTQRAELYVEAAAPRPP